MPSARILIVEDERQTVDTLRDLFEHYGYETEVALNSHVALAILQERKMDLAIVSTSVQDISGIEVLHEIKKLSTNIPIIMIGNQKSKRIESTAVKAGASVFMVKPLNHAFVLQTIEELLEAQLMTVVPKRLRKSIPKSKK